MVERNLHIAPPTLRWKIGAGTEYELLVVPFPHGEIGFDIADLDAAATETDEDEVPPGRFCSNLTVAAARDLIGRLTRAVEHLERQGKA